MVRGREFGHLPLLHQYFCRLNQGEQNQGFQGSIYPLFCNFKTLPECNAYYPLHCKPFTAHDGRYPYIYRELRLLGALDEYAGNQ